MKLRQVLFTVFGFLVCTVTARAQDLPFTQALFDEWIDCRVGDGRSPAIWYCFGEIYAYPSGKLVGRMEGIDQANLIRSSRDTALQLNRKIFVYQDTAGRILEGNVNGIPVRHIEYPYQFIRYIRQQDRLITYVTQGAGEQMVTMGPGYNTRARRAGSGMVFSSPAYNSNETPRGLYEAYENYDFFYEPQAQKVQNKYRLTWNRFGDLPPFLGGGKGIIQLISYRVEKFDDLPESLRKHIETRAPLWRNPPRDLEEIRQMQQAKQ